MLALLAHARTELRLAAAGRVLAAMLIPYAYYFVSADMLALKFSMITVALMIVMERIAIALPLMLIHATLLLASIALIYAAAAYPYLFVFVCALLAFASAGVMRWGEHWKALGTFTLVPGLYIGSELHAEKIAEMHVRQQLPLLLSLVLIPPVFVLFCWHVRLQWRLNLTEAAIVRRMRNCFLAAFQQMWNWDLFWPPPKISSGTRDMVTRMSIARALGAALGAFWVVSRKPDFGEWVIWSTASVVAGDWFNCRLRWLDRMSGVLLGLPLGCVIAQAVPHSQFVVAACILGIYLSLAAFNTYRYAYIFRCTMLAIAVGNGVLLNQVAICRAENVATGCLMGLAAAFITHHSFRRGATGKEKTDI